MRRIVEHVQAVVRNSKRGIQTENGDDVKNMSAYGKDSKEEEFVRSKADVLTFSRPHGFYVVWKISGLTLASGATAEDAWRKARNYFQSGREA